MKKSLLTQILNECYRNLPKHPQYDNFIHFSYLINKNQIISNGVNRKLEPAKFWGYHGANAHLGPTFVPKWHSEVDCLRRSKFDFRNCVMVNVRMSKSGELRMAAPCKTCRNILFVSQIKKCIFSHENGWGELTF